MDVVYLVRHGEQNEELRYSLRSLSNLPHGQVWIFGGAPSWVNRARVNVVQVPEDDYSYRDAWLVKYRNARRNLTSACSVRGVAEHFTLMNDDFYVTEAIPSVPVLNYGPKGVFDSYYLDRTKVPSRYVIGEWDTLGWLEEVGVESPLCYSLHVPMPIVKSSMGEILAMLPETLEPNGNPVHLRTAYGNLMDLGGEIIRDVKVERGSVRGVRRLNGVRITSHTPQVCPTPFASSSDRAFVNNDFPIGRWIRAMFPDPGPYEIS